MKTHQMKKQAVQLDSGDIFPIVYQAKVTTTPAGQAPIIRLDTLYASKKEAYARTKEVWDDICRRYAVKAASLIHDDDFGGYDAEIEHTDHAGRLVYLKASVLERELRYNKVAAMSAATMEVA